MPAPGARQISSADVTVCDSRAAPRGCAVLQYESPKGNHPMTRTDWLNIARCARERRIAEGLHGHWSHWEMPRYSELVFSEFHAQRRASNAGA